MLRNMQTIIEGAGFFLWPFGFLSLLAVFVVVERCLALRASRVIPREALGLILTGDFDAVVKHYPKTISGRIIKFALDENPDDQALLAYARMEFSRMERGLFLLDSVVAIAPLIGLFGTVYGLFILFPETGGMPDQAMLTRGVGLALTTTMLGLIIAMPALFANNLLLRHIDVLASRISLLVERLNSRGR